MQKISSKISLILFVALLTGCGPLAHLDQLLTLKGVSDEQARMDKEVAAQNKKFASLLEAYRKEDFSQKYNSKDVILKKFGSPIFSRPEVKDGRTLELRLYRRATDFFDSDKIYFYFDDAGLLVSSELVAGKTPEPSS